MSIRGSGAAWISGHLCCLGAVRGAVEEALPMMELAECSAALRVAFHPAGLWDHWSSTLSSQSLRGLPCTCTSYFVLSVRALDKTPAPSHRPQKGAGHPAARLHQADIMALLPPWKRHHTL